MNIALIAIFVFGMIIGSFLNVVIYRFNTGRGLGGRSMCFSCNRKLTAIELIPCFSFIFQKGRCSKCKTKLSWQYPAVEFLTGAIFVLSFWKLFSINQVGFGLIFNTVYVWLVMCILIAITVYDLRHKIIPDQWSYSLAILAFIRLFIAINPEGNLAIVYPSISLLSSGPLLAMPFYLIWLVSKGRWMGLGDAKLCMGLGWFMAVYVPIYSPIISNIALFFYAFWIGTAFFLIVALAGYLMQLLADSGILKKKYGGLSIGWKSEIPFAPFLILGLLLVFLLRYNIAAAIFKDYFN